MIIEPQQLPAPASRAPPFGISFHQTWRRSWRSEGVAVGQTACGSLGKQSEGYLENHHGACSASASRSGAPEMNPFAVNAMSDSSQILLASSAAGPVPLHSPDLRVSGRVSATMLPDLGAKWATVDVDAVLMRAAFSNAVKNALRSYDRADLLAG